MLPESEYDHFLLLFVAVRIVSCNIYNQCLPVASKLFKIYVERYESIYGRHNIGSNIHNLIHIVDDMENCGVKNLMEISTYKFENTLRMLGLKLKHSNKPLEQIVCRTIEQNTLESNLQSTESHEIDQSEKFEPKVSCGCNFENTKVFKKIEIAPNLFLSSKTSSNAWFLVKNSKVDKHIVKLEYIETFHLNNKIDFRLYGRIIKKKDCFFQNPIKSTNLDIYESDAELEIEKKTFSVDCVVAKMLCLSYQKKFIFIPILHSLEILNK